MNDEMLEMMKFYEFYKQMKASGINLELTTNLLENNNKTEGAIHIQNNKLKKEGNNKSQLSHNSSEKTKSKKKTHRATRPLDKDEYETIIKHCKDGFYYNDESTGKKRCFRPNPSLAFALALQATLGFRGSDIVNLKVGDFDRSKFSIKEIKTGKWQNRDLNEQMYNKLLAFAYENNLNKDDYIYPNKIRNMQQQLKIITDYLGYKNIGTHSFRKLFAHTLYEESGHDIELVRYVLNHSDIKTTMRYLGVSMKKLKELSDSIDFSYALE